MRERNEGSVGVSNAHAHDRTVGGHPTVRHAVESMLLEERTRWAMQVHDGLTQSVTSAVLELQTLRHRIRTDPDAAIASLVAVEDEMREDLRRIRELLFEMTTAAPGHAEPALVALVRDAMDRWHLRATIEVDGDVDRADEPVLEAAYAIVAEGLANAAKHSGAADAAVRVHGGEDELRVEIEDRGRGIAIVDDDDPHFGLRIMRARAEALGGTLEVLSTPGHGTTVIAVLPVGGRGERG
jgi:signal transduction histidine kinase